MRLFGVIVNSGTCFIVTGISLAAVFFSTLVMFAMLFMMFMRTAFSPVAVRMMIVMRIIIGGIALINGRRLGYYVARLIEPKRYV